MARKKRLSPIYDAAIKRKASLSSIDVALDLGNGLTIAAYETAIEATKTAMDDYNTILSQADEKLNQFKDSENKLKDWNERMLTGVASKYGKGSNEYEKAGGTKKSDIKRTSKAKAATKPGA